MIMFEEYIGKEVRMNFPPQRTDYDYKGSIITFNQDMINALKNYPYVKVINAYQSPSNGDRWIMRARFSDGQLWSIIPEWINVGPALFI